MDIPESELTAALSSAVSGVSQTVVDGTSLRNDINAQLRALQFAMDCKLGESVEDTGLYSRIQQSQGTVQ